MENILKLKEVCINTSSFESAKKAVEEFGCEWKDWYYERAIMPNSLVGDIRNWHPKRMSRIEEVPVSRIIGHDHDRYNFLQQEPHWIELLYAVGDRWKSTDPQKVTEIIIRENLGKSPVQLYKYEDSYFISDGLHRSVHAKFLGLETMRCSVTEFFFDDPKMRRPDITLAKAKLDWEPKVKLDECLAKTIEYFKTRI